MLARKAIFFLIIFFGFFSASIENPQIGSLFDSTTLDPTITQNSTDELKGIQVPIPKEDRVFNKTGIQCVWASIETLGRFAEEKKLYDLTHDPLCLAKSNPSYTSVILKKKNIKFSQSNNYDTNFIKKMCQKERRGVMFDVFERHAMVLVHYDEDKKIVKFIDNLDKKLEIKTWTLKEFNEKWSGWLLVIYADKDIIPFKYRFLVPFLPVEDRNSLQGNYSEDYIFSPPSFF